MIKYYRVLQDNFLWKKGAILEPCTGNNINGSGYHTVPDHGDLWHTSEFVSNEYITKDVVENSPEWFERVYPVNLLTKTVYKVKAEAAEIFRKEISS